MEEEIESLRKNHTCTLVDRPRNQKVEGCKWVLKKKKGIPNVKGQKFKARLMTKGFTQMEGVKYNKIFSHMVKTCSAKILVFIVNSTI